LLSVLVFALAQGAPVFADKISPENESEYYYVNVPIERIYPYRLGYVVEYRKGLIGRAQVYLPIEWFSASAGKGEYIGLASGTSWPYLAVYYKGGEFSHVRLYVRRDMSHETWGNIPQNVNIDSRFENITEIKLDF
jgi:hypothetical protein